MGNYYLKGLNGTLLLVRFMDGPISEDQLDVIKEIVTRCNESMIDDLPLSDQEKEELKYRMKQSADAYNLGIKDGLRIVGRFA